MALKKPVVINDTTGMLEELQSGDSISDPSLVSYTAGEDITAGDAVYISAASTVKKAKADTNTTLPACGIATETVTNGNPILIQHEGVSEGAVSGLTPATVYFVSDATGGALVTTPPSTSGHYVQKFGVTKAATEILVRPTDPIKRA